MNVSIEAWHLVSLALTIFGGFVGGAKLFFSRFESAMKERDESLKSEIKHLSRQMSKESEQIRKLDHDLLELKAELPRDYVSKNDFVRSFTIVEHKLDALSTKIEMANIKVAMNSNHASSGSKQNG